MQLDVLVIGGGPIGALAALIFAKRVSKVRLIEQRPLEMIYQATKSRSLALNAMSVKILKQFDVFDEIRAKVCPIEQVQISVQGHIGTSRIHAKEHDLNALGFVIEQHILEQALYKRLIQENVDIAEQAQFQCLEKGQPLSVIYDAKGSVEKVNTDYLLACDGQFSKAREQLSIDEKTIDYQQTAWVMILSVEKHHGFKAYEHFTSEGAVALLPMKESKLTCVWTLPKAKAKALQSLDDQAFLDQLCQTFKKLAQDKPKLLFKTTFDLKTTLSNKQAAENVLFLGNSAHALHPIAAQGFNLSLRDLNVLSSLLQQNEMSESLLARFVERTKSDQEAIIYYTHFLASFVGTSWMPNWLKATGLMVLEGLPGLKKRVSAFNLGCGLS